jgi:hypothetical protein
VEVEVEVEVEAEVEEEETEVDSELDLDEDSKPEMDLMMKEITMVIIRIIITEIIETTEITEIEIRIIIEAEEEVEVEVEVEEVAEVEVEVDLLLVTDNPEIETIRGMIDHLLRLYYLSLTCHSLSITILSLSSSRTTAYHSSLVTLLRNDLEEVKDLDLLNSRMNLINRKLLIL